MFHNIKVDVIYYKTNTDFEMEFNLCGCCRMRLLTDKAADRKIMVHSLARAVSRSKIIISVGPLFGNEGIISTVASAIGKELETVSNRKFGINTATEIKVIEGSVPLVTPDGIFGGCIIESGPQTMILLTESKNIRKVIMEDLIHPYIAELFASEVLQNKNDTTNNQNSETEEVLETETEEAPKLAEAVELDANIIVPLGIDIKPTVIPIEPSLDITTGLEEITEIKESKIELYVEEEAEKEIDPNDLILDEVEAEPDNEEVLPDIASEELISDIDDEYQSEIEGHIQLIHNGIEEGEPIEIEDPNLIMDAEHEDADILEDELQGIVTDIEEENEEEFRFPEEQRELYYTIDEIETVSRQEQDPQDNEFLLEENKVEKKMNMLNTPILALTILLLILFAVIGYFAFYIPYTQGTSAAEFMREIYETLFK